MRLFTNDTETVIAADLADARLVWHEQVGGDIEDRVWAKKGGCGAKFKDGDATVEKQDLGLADPSDLDNTILKMGCKRSLVAAILNGTAASDCFTQDLEDLNAKEAEYAPRSAA